MLTILFAFAGILVAHAHTNYSYVRVSRQTTEKGCYLPPHPANGQWTIYDTNSKLLPGRLTKARTILETRCQNNYKLDGVEFATCIDREWRPKIGRCLQTCPTITDTFIMTVSCTYNEKVTECVDVLEGTIARFQCSRFYEDRRLESHPFRICSNGSWGNLPECVPVCGRKSGEEPTLIIGGSEAQRGEYPWQIALYTANDKILICGGTLLNQRVILTAAHCITDLNGDLLSKDVYMVAAGKYYRKFDDPRDANETQFSSIAEMFIPKQYHGDLQNYFGDVAILVTAKPFVLAKNIQPICINWGLPHYTPIRNTTKLEYAYVAGWGFTVEYKNPSSVLKVLQVPLITNEECSKKLEEDDKKFLTDDKLCAGFLNSSTSVCKGDSGGGLVYESGGRFYLMAVVSLSPQAATRSGGCDSQQYTLYTNLSYYAESFILEKETRYRNSGFGDIECNQDPTCKATTEINIKEQNCVLPPYPKFGRWRFLGSEDFFPGMLVVPGTILHVTCTKDYKLNANETLVCESGNWSPDIGICLRICPPLKSSKYMNVTCVHNNIEKENCMEAIDGTVATFQCAPFYEDLRLKTRPFVVCRAGSWGQTLPKCQLVCGQKSINGTLATGNYPWHVGIYSTKDKQLVCSGSLVTARIVLTAAHCIANATEDLLSKDNYVVAIGKKYNLFNDSRDINEAQFSELHDMFISSDFHKTRDHYTGDIAMLILQKPFILSEKILPVCLDLGETAVTANRGYNQIGEVPGWRFTSASNSSEVLQEIRVSKSQCDDDDAQEVKNIRTYDQACVGTVDNGPSVCTGDGGSGVVYERQTRYYIRGVVSFPSGLQSSKRCDGTSYTLYTKVLNYLNKFILTYLSKYKE